VIFGIVPGVRALKPSIFRLQTGRPAAAGHDKYFLTTEEYLRPYFTNAQLNIFDSNTDPINNRSRTGTPTLAAPMLLPE
jgi:hypothetical protein